MSCDYCACSNSFLLKLQKLKLCWPNLARTLFGAPPSPFIIIYGLHKHSTDYLRTLAFLSNAVCLTMTATGAK